MICIRMTLLETQTRLVAQSLPMQTYQIATINAQMPKRNANKVRGQSSGLLLRLISCKNQSVTSYYTHQRGTCV